MSDPNRIWAQGDDLELGARQLNFWTQGAQLAQQALGKQSGPPLVNGPHFVPLRIRNATGGNLPQFAVVSFATPLQTPTDNLAQWSLNTTLNAIVPAAPLTRFAILTTGLKADAVAENIAAIGGVVPCRITGTGTKAQAIAGDTAKLQAGTTGHDIVWQESGSAERYALVMLGTASGDATTTDSESCCCPKCNTDLPPSASCDCLPDVCVLVYDAVGDVVDEFAGVWGTGRSFTGTVTVGECSFEVTITNGWGGGPPAVPGLRLTSPDWECLGIPECGLFVAIDCAEWRVGAEVTAQFEIDPSGCEGCEETGSLTIEVRPQKKFRAECEGCDCVDEWMCATLGTLSDKQQQVGGEWTFSLKENPCDEAGISLSVKLEARNAECGECYWKLSLPVAEIAYTDEAYWIAAGCDGVTWTGLVLYPGEENEETVNLTLAKSSCSDCGQDPCCPRGEPATLLGHLWNWFSPNGFDGADELSIGNPGLFLDYCAADGATRIIGSPYSGCATPCSTGSCSTDYACGDLVSGEVPLTWNCEGAVSGRYTGTFNGAFRLHETGSLTPGSTRTLHWIYQVIEIESGCDLGQEGVGFHSRITIKDHPDTPLGYQIADRVILLTGTNESCRPLLVHHLGVAGDPCQAAFDVTESPA